MRCTDRVIGGAAAIAAVDLATKFAAVSLVDGRRLGVIAPTHNDALSLGIASSGRAVVLGLAASALVTAVFATAQLMRRSDLPPWIPAFVLGGAAGNLIDRAIFGSVHDFLVLPPVVLNVADVAVVAGLVGYTRWRRTGGVPLTGA
jgi:lipoprotein signal peptidase